MAMSSIENKESTEAHADVADEGKREVDLYLGNISPVARDFDDPLGWWKVCSRLHSHFKSTEAPQEMQGTLIFMSRVARDVLAIPGVSISCERLFSSVKRTLADSRSSMTAKTASVDIVTKEWLKAGLAEGLDWAASLKLHNV